MCIRLVCLSVFFFFLVYRDHRELHVLTHAFPTRRSSDLSLNLMNLGWRAIFLVNLPIALLVILIAIPVVKETRAQQTSKLDLGRTVLSMVRSEEHTSELQSLMRISYAVFCLKKKNHIIILYNQNKVNYTTQNHNNT